MVPVGGRQRGVALAVEADAVEVREVGVLPRLAAVGREEDGAGRLVDAHDAGHRARARRHLVLETAVGQVVEIQVAPVVALRIPQDFVGGPQHTPAGRCLEVGLLGLRKDGADGAGRHLGHPHRGGLVVARGRHEGQPRGVGAPAHVVHRDVVAEHGAVVVGRHLEAHDGAAVGVDHDPVQQRHRLVTGQRILPRLEHRVAGRGLDQVHLADLAFVLLERGHLLRIRRPQDDRARRRPPAGVVGGVAEVGHAVGRERTLDLRGQVAHPQVPVLDEDRARAVGRGDGVDVAGGAGRAGGAADVAGVARLADVHRNGGAVGRQFHGLEGQPRGLHLGGRHRGQRGRQPLVVEGRGARLPGRVDEHELSAVGGGSAVGEAVVGQPRGRDRAADDQRIHGRAEQPFGPGVIGGGQRRPGRRGARLRQDDRGRRGHGRGEHEQPGDGRGRANTQRHQETPRGLSLAPFPTAFGRPRRRRDEPAAAGVRAGRGWPRIIKGSPTQECAVSEPEEDFAAMFEASVKAKQFDRGQTIEGTIVAFGPKVAFVNVGGKGEAQIDLAELKDAEGDVEVLGRRPHPGHGRLDRRRHRAVAQGRAQRRHAARDRRRLPGRPGRRRQGRQGRSRAATKCASPASARSARCRRSTSSAPPTRPCTKARPTPSDHRVQGRRQGPRRVAPQAARGRAAGQRRRGAQVDRAGRRADRPRRLGARLRRLRRSGRRHPGPAARLRDGLVARHQPQRGGGRPATRSR